MKMNFRSRVILAALAASAFFSPVVFANSALWIGNPGVTATTNWSDNLNWNNIGGGAAGYTNNDVIVGNTGAVGTDNSINAVADTSAESLSMTFTNQSSQFHTILIPTGVTLGNVSQLTVGSSPGLDANNTKVNFTGGGTLVQRGNVTVRNNATTSGSTSLATLDLSSLSYFVCSNSGTLNVGGVGSETRSAGALNLASVSNNITVTTLNLQTTGGNGGNNGSANIRLGAGTNIINVNTLNLNAGKAVSGTISFPGATGGLRIRGANGNADDSSRANMTIANRNNTGTGTINGTLDATGGHPVDIKAGTIVIGQAGSNPTSAGQGCNGHLRFDAGKMDATTINMAINSVVNVANVNGNLVVGTGGSLVVSNVSLVNQTSTGGATGNLYIGGNVNSSGGINKTTLAGTGNVTITNGSLTIAAGKTMGTTGVPIDSLNLENATLTLPAASPNSAAVVTTLNIQGTSDTVNVSSVPGLGQFQLIVYTTLNGTYDFNLGTLPAGYQGYLSNNASGLSVDVVITNILIKTDTWRGNVNGNWDTSTLNWVSSGNPASFLQGDAVVFDDTLTGTPNVNLTTTLLPSVLTVNNSSATYVFSGTGKLSGLVGLTKSGTGSLRLSASGGDDFSGGVNVTAGTVILDNSGSAISGGITVANGATAQIGNNSANGVLPGGPVVIDGTLVFSRTSDLTVGTVISGSGGVTKTASGKITLTGINNYTGNTTVNAGTLAISGAGTISNSPQVSVTSATLDVSGVSGQAILSTLDLTSAALTASVPYGQTPVSVAALNMGGAGNTINIAALPPIASYPVTLKIVQCAGAIVGFNATLGTLPAATPSYAGSISQSGDQTAILLTLTAGPTATRPYVSWTGADAPDLNWSERLNWELPGAPGVSDNAIFTGTAVGGDNLTVNNIVDASTTIATLTYSNSVNGQWHVTEIPSGNTLTVSGTLTVGGLTGVGAPTFMSLAAMSGGGTLVATGPSLTVANGGTAGGLNGGNTLDLSALSNFVFSAAGGALNVGNVNRSTGSLLLGAVSNHITTATINLNTGSSSSSGNSQALRMGGGTNVVNANTVNVGANRTSATVDFITSTGGLRLRGAGGTDTDRANMVLGLRNTGASAGGTTTGTLSFNGHPVDLKLGTVTLGQMTRAGTEANLNGNGVINFDTGAIDATTINMAVCSGNSPTAGANGTLNVGAGATLLVGNISLANMTSPGVGANATGTLNVTGGSATVTGNIVKTTTTGSGGNINVTAGGTLRVGGVAGTPTAPIDTLTLDSSTLRLNLDGSLGAADIVATTITPSGVTTISLDSVSNAVAATTYPLISYTGANPFSSLTLGTLPAGYSGSLVDDTANSVIGITFTVVPLAPPDIANVSVNGGNLVFSGSGGPANASYVVLSSTSITLPRSAWTRVVTNTFDGSGNFSYSTPVDPAQPVRFFSIVIP